MDKNKSSVIITIVITIVFIAAGIFLGMVFMKPSQEQTTANHESDFIHPPISPQTEQVIPAGQISEKEHFQGAVLAGNSAMLLDFKEIDFQKAINSDKLVVLYFYASWCPICKEEVANALYPAFDELERDDVVGFQVNFNDNDTDKAEQELAKEYGVAYQHTKVFLKNGERVLKSPESWGKERYLEEIDQALNN